jgi:hypothetical protein
MAFDPRYDATGAGMPPRRFILYRRHDATGVSGTGIVATGVVWPDGHAALRWKANDPTEASSTSVWSSVADLLRVHGHGGLSKIFYLDGDGAEERAQESGSGSGAMCDAETDPAAHRDRSALVGLWAWPR